MTGSMRATSDGMLSSSRGFAEEACLCMCVFVRACLCFILGGKSSDHFISYKLSGGHKVLPVILTCCALSISVSMILHSFSLTVLTLLLSFQASWKTTAYLSFDQGNPLPNLWALLHMQNNWGYCRLLLFFMSLPLLSDTMPCLSAH